MIPVLSRTARRVEAAAYRGKVRPNDRTAYQVVALLVREERARVKADTTTSEAERAALLTRLDGIATTLAKTAVRDTTLLALLAEGAVVSPSAMDLKNDLLRAAGREPEPEEEPEARVRRRPGADDASGGPADGHRPPAGEPLPGAGLLCGAVTSPDHQPAR